MKLWHRILHWVRRRRAPLLHIAVDQGEGPPVILVHGVASSSVTFEKLVPLLDGHHRCIAIDLLGFGGSPAPADAAYTIEEHVRALHATIRRLRLREPFVLVGHSLGALLASRYAANYPRGIRQLVLVGPPIYPAPAGISDPLLRAGVGAYLRAYEYLRANKEFTTRSSAAIARLLPIRSVLTITEQNWPAFVGSMQNCIESQTTISDIAAVRAPIDVVYGSLDQFIAPGSLGVVAAMRHVTMHRVEVGDHLIRSRLAREIARVIVSGSSPSEEETSEASRPGAELPRADLT